MPALKAPWQMTRQEWEMALEATRFSWVPEKFNHKSAARGVAQIKEMQRLIFGVKDEYSAQIRRAMAREIVLTPEQAEEVMEALQTPTTHRDVIERAILLNLPVPPEVLAEYPELLK